MIRPIRLREKELPLNIFYSPLAGVSDFSFRKMSAKYKPGLQYCEMVKMEALLRRDQGTLHILDYSQEMHPIGAQLVGSQVEIAATCSRMIEDMGFDVLDLNCGCPVDKVTKDGSGSGLLKHPEKIGDLIFSMRSAVSIPVTLKIRAGWDEETINAVEITKIAEQAGADAIAIHGRTRAQGYSGFSDLGVIKACKEAATKIKVIGNGDLFSPEAAETMFLKTGCDAILVSRGAMGAPWIVEDMVRHFRNQEPIERSEEFIRGELIEHARHIMNYYTEKKVVSEMRRVGCTYIKKHAAAKRFRQEMSRASSLPEVLSLLSEEIFD